jgi:hypothetical protein
MSRPEGSKNKKGVSKFCSKGHDIVLVGRTKSGNCKICQQQYYKERWEFIRKNFPKSSL